MAKKKKKKTELSSEGKTELAKAIAEKSQTFAKTYARVEIQISKFFRWISGWLDKLLFNQKHGKVVALILAILVYVSMNSANANIFESTKSAEDLGSYDVSQVISSQNYEVIGLPKKVKVRVIGDLSDIKNIKQQSNFRVIADMTNMTEGVHEVTFTTEGAPSHVDVVLEPSSKMVTIKKKSIRKFNVGYDFLNRSVMDSTYDLGEPVLEQGEVLVRASTETLDKIAYVKALVKVGKNVTSDFETKAKVYAYDSNGNRMNVDIIPDTLLAKVKVSRPEKNVDVVLSPTGTIPNGKAIESYTVDYPEVTIYGSQAVLDNIIELPITIPASTLTGDKEISMPIILPNGVTKVSKGIVNFTIKLAKAESRTVSNVDIDLVNSLDGFDFTIEGITTSEVTVKGAKTVIDSVESKNIKISADLSKINKAGTYEVEMLVEGSNKLASYELKTTTVKVKAVKKQ
ncbi:MAG: CdaR family protein [Longicatena sp.]